MEKKLSLPDPCSRVRDGPLASEFSSVAVLAGLRGSDPNVQFIYALASFYDVTDFQGERNSLAEYNLNLIQHHQSEVS